jgi:hypothetical protein
MWGFPTRERGDQIWSIVNAYRELLFLFPQRNEAIWAWIEEPLKHNSYVHATHYTLAAHRKFLGIINGGAPTNTRRDITRQKVCRSIIGSVCTLWYISSMGIKKLFQYMWWLSWHHMSIHEIKQPLPCTSFACSIAVKKHSTTKAYKLCIKVEFFYIWLNLYKISIYTIPNQYR